MNDPYMLDADRPNDENKGVSPSVELIAFTPL